MSSAVKDIAESNFMGDRDDQVFALITFVTPCYSFLLLLLLLLLFRIFRSRQTHT